MNKLWHNLYNLYNTKRSLMANLQQIANCLMKTTEGNTAVIK